MTNKLNDLTNKQKDEICYVIGEWYLRWKQSIVDHGIPHRLGVAKEELKMMICGDPDDAPVDTGE